MIEIVTYFYVKKTSFKIVLCHMTVTVAASPNAWLLQRSSNPARTHTYHQI